MPEYDIQCATCGGQYVARRSDAKQCSRCRLLRILTYAASKYRARTCKACGARYAPVRRQDRLCASCDTAAPTNRAPIVTCGICKRDAPMFERVAVCLGCIKGVESQPVVIRALKKGQAARKAKRDNPQPAP